MTTEARSLKRNDIDVRGGRMHYVEKGTGDPVVMIHGYAPISSWRVWNANIDELSTNNRIIAVDLPGYGESSGPEGGIPSDFGEWFWINARAVHDLIHGLDLGPVTLCGLSAGGAASLLLASEWPKDVARLILVDSAGSQQTERWQGITVPTLIVWQKEDRLLPLDEHAPKLQAAIDGSTLEVIDGNPAGIEPYDWHWPQALNPARFNQVVAEFLKGSKSSD
ncbi:MAG TPA: alpha/beta hydrolase [Chloroflexota bacterium]|nr:alpha/beta hydrolase [Chloroflexota bacterium]